MKLTAALAVVASAAGGLTGPAAGDDVRAEASRLGAPQRSIDAFVRDVLPAGAGGTVLAVRDGKRVYSEGFGMADREARVPARSDTVYDVMSITKQFTAAAILKLQMKGKLDTGDPISKYIGPVPDDKREITVQQLLTHTSGLVEALGGDYERLSRRAMIDGALVSRLRASPGTRYRYSNLGYSLLAAIVEEASGVGYEEFLHRNLFRPAGMTDTGYVLPDWKRRRVAVEYDAKGEPQGRPFDHPWAEDGPYWNLRGNGGLLSTARDMFRWERALEGDDVLDQGAKTEMFEPRVREQPGGDSYYGYGWVIQQTAVGDVAWHNGGNGWSYGELTRLLDEPVMVFWITNRYRGEAAGWNFNRLGPELTRGLVKRLLGGR